MLKEELDAIAERLSEEYEFQPSTIHRYYRLLNTYPVFYDDHAEECLELLCQERNSAELKYGKYLIEHKKNPEGAKEIRYDIDSLDSSIKKVLKIVYPDYYDQESIIFNTPRIYDANEYDIMEREELEFGMLNEYYNEIESMMIDDRTIPDEPAAILKIKGLH